ncbi:nitrilase-related carbon-nitrogen hydrolase [Sinorhizobium sp. GL28]|uniref:nitrilase-related carbon-nitrogen hydrolase n=1 Tax=Sinorhizobium sp. GL28 TaxID=1358418 RepID=UPI000DDDB2D7
MGSLASRAQKRRHIFWPSAKPGSHAQGRKLCWGHSLAIDPWGRILAQSPDSVGSISVTLDLDYTKTVRAAIPVADHRVL